MIITKYPEKILVYEALGFLAILAMSVFDEAYEIPKRYFAGLTSQPEIWEGSFEIVVILVIAIAILLMTNRLVKRLFYLEGLLKVCAWCGRIQHENEWISLERYFASGFDTQTTHGMCPDCFLQTREDGSGTVIPPREGPPDRPGAGPAPPDDARVPARSAAPR